MSKLGSSLRSNICYTYKYAFNWVSKVLLGKGHGGCREDGGAGEPVMKPENPTVDLDRIKVGKPKNVNKDHVVKRVKM